MTENLIKGQIIELKVQEEMLRYGFDVSIPTYNASRYDLIVDTGKELLRIQVKKALGKIDNSFTIDCYSSNVSSNSETSKRRYTIEEIDYFATVWKDKTYLIPVDETSYQKTLYEDSDEYLAQNVLASYTRMSDDDLYNYANSKKNHCIRCGAPILSSSIYCTECKHYTERVVERPNRDELKELVYNFSFAELGKQFGVSDNAIRKWCIKENIPSKRSEIKKYSKEEWDKI